MCWNREVSIITGTTAMALSVYLLIYGKGNDIPVALISITIALMQYAEALMWEGHDSSDARRATLGGNVGLVALFLQPLALGLGIAWIRGWLWGGLGFFAMWGILGLPTLFGLLQREWPVHKGNCGHLQWSFLAPMLASQFAPLYWIVILGGWLLFRPLSEGIHYSALAFATLMVTQWAFPGEWGTLWCFLANLLPLGRLL